MSPSRTALFFAKSFARRLLPNNRAMKIGLLLVGAGLLLALAMTTGGFALSLRGRRRTDARLVQLEEQVARESRQRLELERDIAEERQKAAKQRTVRDVEVAEQLASLKTEERHLKSQLEEARAHATLSASQIAKVQGKLQETKRQITSLDTERSLAERTIRKYQSGVGFIDGTWSWRDDLGKAVHRDPERAGWEAEASGQSQFVGTGFLVSKDGLILTNRHIAEPWWRERKTRVLVSHGFVPRLDGLEIFFPGIEAPFPLSVVAISKSGDVALVKAEIKGHKIPLVEMDPEAGAASPGQKVVILGYPTGLDALLARIDDPVAEAIVARAKGDWSKIARELSRRAMIRPLATQGHLSDVLESQLVYDAVTAQGGSGGPVFNARGHVIGLTSAALTDFPAATFGVPIRLGLELFPGISSARKAEAERQAAR